MVEDGFFKAVEKKVAIKENLRFYISVIATYFPKTFSHH